MTFISYAPNFEDVLLQRALGHVAAGFYIDAGAADPAIGSVTQAFYARGWRGVNLEPSAALHARLAAARPADVNLPHAAAAAAGSASFYDAGASGESGFAPALAERCRAAGVAVLHREVQQTTLDAVCAAHVDGPIHFVNLAVNGAEAGALAGFDLARWQPWIVLVHAGAGAEAWQRLAGAGYTLAYQDGHKRYYVAPQQQALAAALALPPHPADGYTLCEDHPYAWPLDEWRRRTEAAESAVRAANDWVAASERGWNERAEHADARLAQAQADLRHTENVLAEQLANAERAQQAEAATLAALDGATRRAEHNEWLAADTFAKLQQAEQTLAATRAELHGIYASRAWRLSRPIRGAVKAVRYVRQRLRHWSWQARHSGARVLRAVRRAPAGLARRGVKAALRYITARPALAFWLRRQAGRSPRLVGMLRALAMRSQAQPAPATPDAPACAEREQLAPAARQIYDDLQRALQHSRNR
ncbi:FkbM family methyltransferase [Pseudoduganella sp. UC29_71]|uniref:FkbM family methyltransferase n=1 Tax=Pseudoduganella sp. UC29_71 TaxID=3350174 RepID=UPI00366D6ED8